MKLNLPQTLNCILIGSAMGAISGVLISIIKLEISQSKMAQSGAFIGAVASTASVAMVSILDNNNRG